MGAGTGAWPGSSDRVSDMQRRLETTHARVDELRQVVLLHRPVLAHLREEHRDRVLRHGFGTGRSEDGREGVPPELEAHRRQSGLCDCGGDEVELELGGSTRVPMIRTHVESPPCEPPVPLPPRPEVGAQPRLGIEPLDERGAIVLRRLRAARGGRGV
jgi:hypothetical protein